MSQVYKEKLKSDISAILDFGQQVNKTEYLLVYETDQEDSPSFKRQINGTTYQVPSLGINETSSNHPMVRYLRRLRRIYQLDIEILDQLANVLEGVSDKVVPEVARVLEPILAVQKDNNLEFNDTLGQVLQAVHATSFHAGALTTLGGLDFIEFGESVSLSSLHGCYHCSFRNKLHFF